MNTWRDFTRHKRDVSKKLDADFNIPKSHLISHWVEQIRRYGAFQQYSTKRHEEAHKTNLKDGWNASNHNLNYLPQVFSIQLHIFCVEISKLNLQTLAPRRENSAAT